MTCIAAVVDGGKVILGGDSAGVGGSCDMSIRGDEKVFRVGNYGFGFVDSFRMGQLLRYSLDAPEPPGDPDHLHRFLATTFIDSVRFCLEEGGFSEKKNNIETGGVFLLGVSGRLFRIDEDFQVGYNLAPYDAAGAGESLAIGSLHTTRKQRNPKNRVQVALEAASEHCSVVAPPFNFIEVRA